MAPMRMRMMPPTVLECRLASERKRWPSSTPANDSVKVTAPIVRAVAVMDGRNSSPTPTARASMLVATASVRRCPVLIRSSVRA